MSGPPPSSRLSFSASVARVFDLSLGQMLWSRRSVFLGLVVGGPVVMAASVRALTWLALGRYDVWFPLPARHLRQLAEGSDGIGGMQVDGAALFGIMIWLLYVRVIVPVLGVFYGTALIADEVDDKTLTYLFTRPIPRSAVLAGKYLAYLACTSLLVMPSVVLVFFLAVPIGASSVAAEFPGLVADLGMVALGLAAYGAVFAFVGTSVKRPLVAGLIFAFGWEPAILLVPGYLKWLSVAYYLQGLVKHEMPQESPVSALLQVFREVPSLATSLVALAIIVFLGVSLAGRAVERREYVLEQ